MPFIESPMDNALFAINEGDTATFTCEVIGYPKPTVIWSTINGTSRDRTLVSDSVSVPTGDGNKTRVSRNLTIMNASREDPGVYICNANNSIGTDSRSVRILCKCMKTAQ